MYQVNEAQHEADRALIAAVTAWRASIDGPHQDHVRALGCDVGHPSGSLSRREAELYRAAEAHEAAVAAAAAGTPYPAEATR